MTKRLDAPSSAVRIRVMKRDRFRCTYCGASGNDSELEIDHIVAVSKGGSHHMSNLTLLLVVSATDIVPMEKSFIYSKNCLLQATNAHMLHEIESRLDKQKQIDNEIDALLQ